MIFGGILNMNTVSSDEMGRCTGDFNVVRKKKKSDVSMGKFVVAFRSLVTKIL